MRFDSPEWQAERNKKLVEWVKDENAIQFLLDVADAGELFDDLIDKDKPIRDEHVIRVLFNLLTSLPVNPFFDRFKLQLVPIMLVGINAWLDSNKLENGSDNDKVFAYVLRGWYVEMIFFVIYATRGRDYMRSISLEVRDFFTRNESLDEYREKLK